jgi:uncharacterized protein YjbI with pentapeptide repeats
MHAKKPGGKRMANQEHLDILKKGVDAWNKWRKEHPKIRPALIGADLKEANLSVANLSQANLIGTNLSQAHLSGANLSGANLSQAHLSNANLSQTHLGGANLSQADLSQANLNGADLFEADLSQANLSGADLREADLSQADLRGANLSQANLSGADLSWSNLSEAILREANLTGCKIYAISAWNVYMEKTIQTGLVITRDNEATITVDNLEVAQFIYLLLNNQKIREVIDTIAKKAVLLLGRFTPEHKAVLDALRNELRTYGYVPIVFDFEKPGSRDFTETVRTLAHLARFIIADLTDPSSIPQELQAIVPDLAVPVQPLLLEAKREYSMFVDFRKYHWVLPVHLYKDQTSLIASLKNEIIEPAEQKAQELVKR